MKIFFRTLLYLALILWLGAEAFFPMVAAITFMTLSPDTHTAGTIVGQLLRILHEIGLVSGIVALIILAIAPTVIGYKSRHVLAPMLLLVLMLAATSYSQFSIIPTMERVRIAAGGAIDSFAQANPQTIAFNRLHRRSEHVESAILLLGLATVASVAFAENSRT